MFVEGYVGGQGEGDGAACFGFRFDFCFALMFIQIEIAYPSCSFQSELKFDHHGWHASLVV